MSWSFDAEDHNQDPRVGAPDCDCGHTSMRHHGESRPLNGTAPNFLRTGEHNGCKDCTWCDYYKARWIQGKGWAFSSPERSNP